MVCVLMSKIGTIRLNVNLNGNGRCLNALKMEERIIDTRVFLQQKHQVKLILNSQVENLMVKLHHKYLEMKADL